MLCCIIQARMTSTRLPGKVLMKIDGKPVLEYLLRQLKFVPKVGKIMVATTTNKEDDPIVQYAASNGIECYRGSEHDVLERFYLAAQHSNADHVMRITGDCPLIDPDICSTVIDSYLTKKYDLVHTGVSFAEGLDCEVFSFNVLEIAHQSAKKPSEREHVTLFMHQRPHRFKKLTLENSTDDSSYRFTIDELADFKAVEQIINGIDVCKRNPIRYQVVKEFLISHPEIVKLNASILRNEGLKKSLEADSST